MLSLRGDTKPLSQPLVVKAITVTRCTLQTYPYQSTKNESKEGGRGSGRGSVFSRTHHVCQNFDLIFPGGRRHFQWLGNVQNNTRIKVKGITWKTKFKKQGTGKVSAHHQKVLHCSVRIVEAGPQCCNHLLPLVAHGHDLSHHVLIGLTGHWKWQDHHFKGMRWKQSQTQKSFNG